MTGDILVNLIKDEDERIIQFNNSADATFTVTKEAFIRFAEHLAAFEDSEDTTAYCLLDAIDHEDEHDLKLAAIRETIAEIESEDGDMHDVGGEGGGHA